MLWQICLIIVKLKKEAYTKEVEVAIDEARTGNDQPATKA